MAGNNWEIYFNAVKKQDWEAARNVLRKISVAEKDNSQVYLKMGDVSQRLGDTQNAIDSYHNSARLLRLQGFGNKAIALYKIILRLDPGNRDAIQGSEQLINEMESAKQATRPGLPLSEDSDKGAELSSPATEEQLPVDTGWTIPGSFEPAAQPSDAAEWGIPGFSEPVDQPPAEIAGSPGPAEEQPDAADSDISGFYETAGQTPEETGFVMPETTGPAEEPVPGTEWELLRTTDFSDAPSGPAGWTPPEFPEQAEGIRSNEEWSEPAFVELPEESPAFSEESRSPEVTEEPAESSQWAGSVPPAFLEGTLIESEDIFPPVSPQSGLFDIPELFSGMSQEEFIRRLDEMDIRSFSDGTKVVEEGDSGDLMYLIRSGSARVVAHLLGREIELARLREGDIFGEVAFLTGRPRTASVIATDKLEVYEIRRIDIEKILEKNPGILSKLEDFNERRVKETIKKIMPQ